MLRIRTPTWPFTPTRFGTSLRLGLLAALLFTPAPSWAAPSQETFILILFGDAPPTEGSDANRDGALTVADLLVLLPAISATPTPVRTPTATAPPAATQTPVGTDTPVSTATATPTAIPSATPRDTPTPTPRATLTPTPAATGTPTPTATPLGLLFAGTVSDLVPHAVGDRLVYRVTHPSGKVSTETTVVISSNPNGTFVVDDQIVPGETQPTHERQTYEDKGSQLLFLERTDVRRDVRTDCDPGLVRVTLPVIAGQTTSTARKCQVYSGNSNIGTVDRIDTFTPIRIIDSVTVGERTYTNVIHFEGFTDTSGEEEINSIDLAPGVGTLQRSSTYSGKTTRFELIDGTIGGVSVKQ